MLITSVFWKWMDLQNFGFVLLVSFICPFLIAPPTIMAFCRLNVNLNKSRLELEDYKESLERRVDERTRELQLAMAELKTLKGLLPICSHCKMIRDENGNWNQIDDYIRRHSEAQFTHGVCPECMKKHYPGL